MSLSALRPEAGPSFTAAGHQTGDFQELGWVLGTLLSVLFLSDDPSSPKGGWHPPCGWGQGLFLRPLSPNVSWVLPTKLWAALALWESMGGPLCRPAALWAAASPRMPVPWLLPWAAGCDGHPRSGPRLQFSLVCGYLNTLEPGTFVNLFLRFLI